MKINKLYFCLAVSLLAITIAGSFSTAYAADPDKWTSFYAGINVGYGMGRATTSFMPMVADPDLGIVPNPTDFEILMPQQLHPQPNGILGGGQVGFNVQLKRFVIGAEADLQGTGMDGKKVVSPVAPFDSSTEFDLTGSRLVASQHTNYFGTFRPRIGVVLFPKLLFYTTGGLAYGSVDMYAETNYSTTPYGSTNYILVPPVKGKQKTGWTAGGGLEYKLGKRLSVKGEYLFYDLGTEHIIGTNVPDWDPYYVGYGIATKAHIIRAGVNFRIK